MIVLATITSTHPFNFVRHDPCPAFTERFPGFASLHDSQLVKRDALAFLKKVAEDEELIEALKTVKEDGVVKIAEGLGFDVTFDDITSVLKEVKGEGELGEEELDLVSGGISRDDMESWIEENADKLRAIFNILG